MTTNLFDYFEAPETGEEQAISPWAARAPRRPQPDFDLQLFPRKPSWQEDPEARGMLEQLEREPWVRSLTREQHAVRVRLSDAWIELTGAALEAGGSAETHLSDLADERKVSVQFWDANATKALHVGHLRNLAIGNALSAALAQAGAKVERRSRITDL